ncbi:MULTISPECIES: hypothetical protein [unclassified Marinovum]
MSVAIGLGVAFTADFIVLSHLRSRTTPRDHATLETCHSVVTLALVGMWASGLALIYLRTGFVWAEFSPKLLVKLLVVAVLTFNAVLIGRYALPMFRTAGARGIWALGAGQRNAAVVIGGVSTASWLFALALGSSKFLATSSATVFLCLLPLVYGTAILTAISAVSLLRVRVKPVIDPPAPA